MGDWGEDALRHKYDPLPEDAPRHRKKSKKHHVRSDHRHEYEKVCIDANLWARTRKDGRFIYYSIGERCRICGRLRDWTMDSRQREKPDGMRLFKVKDLLTLFGTRFLPDDMEVTE